MVGSSYFNPETHRSISRHSLTDTWCFLMGLHARWSDMWKQVSSLAANWAQHRLELLMLVYLYKYYYCTDRKEKSTWVSGSRLNSQYICVCVRGHCELLVLVLPHLCHLTSAEQRTSPAHRVAPRLANEHQRSSEPAGFNGRTRRSQRGHPAQIIDLTSH